MGNKLYLFNIDVEIKYGNNRMAHRNLNEFNGLSTDEGDTLTEYLKLLNGQELIEDAESVNFKITKKPIKISKKALEIISKKE
jgi:hypothetical protein